jgi:predicted transcriptional regulator
MRERRYRNRYDIIASLLEVANGNRVRTSEFKFKADLPSNLLKEYLAPLLENGLLEYIEDRSFKTTPKGIYYLHMYNQMREMTMMTNTDTRKPVSELLLEREARSVDRKRRT